MSNLTILDLSEARWAIPAPPVSVAVVEAAAPNLFYGGTGSDGFRPLSQRLGERDLMPHKQWRMQATSYYLYVANPLAHRIVELTKDFCVGEGVTFKAKDPEVQKVIDDFRNFPDNSLDLNLENYVREFSIFGEQLWVCYPNPISGAVTLGYVDPAWIDAVEYGTLEGLPGIAVAMPITVILKSRAGEKEGRRLQVVRRDDDPYSPNFGRLAGECFYFSINKARAASRGISDLFALSDWIDGYDKMLFALMTQMDSLSRFIWDVTLTGMTGEQVSEWLKNNSTAPRPNSIRAHNEKEVWQSVAPDIQGADKSEGARLVKNLSLGGAGFPEHWFADGGTTNRATALEQGEPTLKMLTSRQRLLKYMLTSLLDYVIDAAITAGTLPEEIDRTFTVTMPELSPRDAAKAATAVASLAESMGKFQEAGVVDLSTVAMVLATSLTQIGVDVDAASMLEAAANETNPAAVNRAALTIGSVLYALLAGQQGSVLDNETIVQAITPALKKLGIEPNVAQILARAKKEADERALDFYRLNPPPRDSYVPPPNQIPDRKGGVAQP